MARHERSTSVIFDPAPGETGFSKSMDKDAMAAIAYRFWMDRGCPMGSDQEDWFRAEAMLKNAFVAAEFASEGWQGHWEVWEREWAGAQWVWDRRPRSGAVSADCSGPKAMQGQLPQALGIENVVGSGDAFSELVDRSISR